MKWPARLALLAGLLTVFTLWIAARPSRPLEPTTSRPSASYDDAVRRVDRMRAAEGDSVHPLCRTSLLTHGVRTPTAIVLLHGLTNCPRQFERLGEDLYRDGSNVLIPRAPRHGLKDRMTQALAALTAEELARWSEEAVDIASGLGERVSVVGLSSGAVAAAWLAQHRPEIDRAVLLAPSLAPKGAPLWTTRRVTNILLRAPNVFVWWDARRKEASKGPRYAYPRFTTRALAEVYRLGFAVFDRAAEARARAGAILIVTTQGDEGVNNDAARELARSWRAQGAAVREYEFPLGDAIHHDMIDPEQPYQRISVTYRFIAGLLRKEPGEVGSGRLNGAP